MIIISVVKSRPITGGIYLKSEGHPSAYGLFDCRTRSGGGENALICYGILQPLFHGTASCPIPFRHSTLPTSTSSRPKVSKKNEKIDAKELAKKLLNDRTHGAAKVGAKELEKAGEFAEGYKSFMDSARQIISHAGVSFVTVTCGSYRFSSVFSK